MHHLVYGIESIDFLIHFVSLILISLFPIQHTCHFIPLILAIHHSLYTFTSSSKPKRIPIPQILPQHGHTVEVSKIREYPLVPWDCHGNVPVGWEHKSRFHGNGNDLVEMEGDENTTLHANSHKCVRNGISVPCSFLHYLLHWSHASRKTNPSTFIEI